MPMLAALDYPVPQGGKHARMDQGPAAATVRPHDGEKPVPLDHLQALVEEPTPTGCAKRLPISLLAQADVGTLGVGEFGRLARIEFDQGVLGDLSAFPIKDVRPVGEQAL